MAKQTVLGRWWIPGQREHAVVGILEWEDAFDAMGKLELMGDFRTGEGKEEGFVPLVLGESDAVAFNLFNCAISPWPSGSKNHLHWSVTNILSNSHLESADHPAIKGCQVHLDGLGGWITAQEFSNAELRDPSDESASSSESQYRLLATFNIADTKVELLARALPRSVGVLDDQDCLLQLTPHAPKTFEEIRNEIILPLQALINLATASSGSVSLAIFSTTSFELLHSKGGVWTGHRPFVHRWKVKPLFSARELESFGGRDLKKWAEIYQEHSYLFNTFQGITFVPHTPQAAVYFLALVSALEALLSGYVNERFPKEVLNQMRSAVRKLIPENVRDEVIRDMGNLKRSTLRSKLDAYISQQDKALGNVVTDKGYRNWVTKLISDTRNCAAHSSPDSCKNAAKGQDLHALQEFVRKIFNIRILELLGFPSEEIPNCFINTFEFGSVDELETMWQKTKHSTS